MEKLREGKGWKGKGGGRRPSCRFPSSHRRWRFLGNCIDCLRNDTVPRTPLLNVPKKVNAARSPSTVPLLPDPAPGRRRQALTPFCRLVGRKIKIPNRMKV